MSNNSLSLRDQLQIFPSFDGCSLYSNIFGIFLWTFLYIFLKIYTIPSEVNYIHGIYFGILSIYLTNIWMSDTTESSYEREMKLKDDVENLASRLSILIVTVLFSTSVLSKYKHVPERVKQHFMTILSMALVLLLMISSNISTHKKSEPVRKLRKLEAAVLNASVGLIGVSFVYMIHYM